MPLSILHSYLDTTLPRAKRGAGAQNASVKHAHVAQHNAAPDFSADSPLDGAVQVAPEFSLRLLDESYAADNAQIGKIQDLMVDYFKTRTSDLARGGLNALR